jgi:hypothetical protein
MPNPGGITIMSQPYARTRALYVRAATRRYLTWPAAVAGMLIVGLTGGAIGATQLGARSAPAAASPAEAQNAVADVSLTKCALDPGTGWPRAALLVTNHLETRASYLVTIAFESEDGAVQYASAPASVEALAPGQKATAVAEALNSVPHAFTCAVASVDRA